MSKNLSADVVLPKVIAPKLNPKNSKEDEPCGFEAREFLRKKLIGKKVTTLLLFVVSVFDI